MADPVLGGPIGGPGPGLGFGFPGIGGGIGLDIGGGLGGLGIGGPGAFGIGGPGGIAGFAPYVPVTPLGALDAIKGDLLYPIVAIGVAIFILIIIVLAVKAALVWKMEMMSDIMGGPRARREATEPPVQNTEYMTQLSSIVMNALESESCLDKIICSIGSYGKGSSWPGYVSMMESLVSEDYKHSLALMKDCADGKVKIEKFQCGRPLPNKPAEGDAVKPVAGPANVTSTDNSIKSNEV